MASYTAMPLDLYDDGSPKTLRDESGSTWLVIHDAADGTLAVEEVAYPSLDRLGGAGVFRWGLRAAGGTIYKSAEGSTYGVNCQDELVVVGGRWENAE